MKFELFKSIVTLIDTEQRKRDEYLERIPDDIKDFVFDNLYTNSYGWCHDRLAETALGDLWEDVAYYIYERPIMSNVGKVVVDGVEHEFSNLEEFLDFMQKVHQFD
jgi:hypothetical protein